jgi:hypothetical protein
MDVATGHKRAYVFIRHPIYAGLSSGCSLRDIGMPHD